jgi:putative DNA primase/helicase
MTSGALDLSDRCTSTLGRQALALAERGYFVFPLKPKSKLPITKHGFKEASNKPEQIIDWWTKTPRANIGLACGASGISVLDIDAKAGGDPGVIVPEWGGDGPVVATGTARLSEEEPDALDGVRGAHVYFKGVSKTRVLGLPGCEVRSKGAYVLAPGSIHPSGDTYAGDELPHVDELPEAPEWPAKCRQQPNGDARAATTGERHDRLLDEGIRLRNEGLEPKEIRDHLHELNDSFPSPKGVEEVDAIADWIAEHPVTFMCTDMGNAERLALRAKQKHLYVSGLDWLYWDGVRWDIDTMGYIEREARATVRAIYDEAKYASDPEISKRLGKHAVRSESATRLEAMMRLAKSYSELRADAKELDAYPHLLNVQNGVLNLETCELIDHNPELLLTKVANAEYDESAECPYWEETLERFVPDEEVRAWLQKAIGYSMLGSYSEFLFIPYGKGANGKSTILGAVRHVLGDYALEAAPELLSEKRERNAESNAAMADLRGIRFVTTIETGQGKKMAEAQMKQLTGEGKIKAKFMRQNWFEFDNQTAVWLATNHKPVVQGTDHAVWRRVRLVPFTETIPPEEQVEPAIVKRELALESAGILRWIVEGLLLYRIEGLEPEPKAVLEATQAYRDEMDPLAGWIEDCCELDPRAHSPVAVVRASYEEHCMSSGNQYPLGGRTFKQELEERFGLKQDRRQVDAEKQRVWVGISIPDMEA